MNSFLQTLFYLLVFGSILFLAAVAARFFGAKANKSLQGRNLRVVETLALGVDKRLLLVKAGKEYLLLATSGKAVTFLTTLKLLEEEVAESEEKSDTLGFKAFLEKYVQGFKASGQESEADKTGDDATGRQDREYNLGFKSNLDRLKKMVAVANSNSKEDNDENTNEK